MHGSALIPLLFVSSTFALQDVAYQRFTLDNGLTVILHEDHSLPQVVVNTWYRVGSKDERPGRSGFAHLFEHLMFRGTQRVPDSSFDEIMEAGGGWNNATTSSDRTNYYDVGPTELLPTLLWLEADRMEALGPNMTQAKLDREREVVRNERRQSYEDRPYGQAFLLANPLLYPFGHPYHIPVIGTHEDLEAATVQDVKDFFAEYYVPNNACLVVAGDFDDKVVRPMIERLFGSIPRGSDVLHAQPKPVTLSGNKVHTITDRVPFARTEMLWHSPAFLTAGDAEMDILAGVLGGGVSSRLYRDLVVERALAEDVAVRQRSAMLGSSLSIAVMARPGVALDTLEAALDEVLAEFLSEGFGEAEIERQKALLEAKMLRGLQSIQRKAELLNRYQFYFDEPGSFHRDLDRFRQADVESCTRWAREVLDGPGRVTLRVLPEAQTPEINPLDLPLESLEPVAFEPELPQRFTLPNGTEVSFWSKPSLPMVEMRVVLPVGSALDPPGKGGLNALVASMLSEGAGDMDSAEFERRMDGLGATFTTHVDRESTRLELFVLARNFLPALELLADAMLRPRFDAKEWERVKREREAELLLSEQDPGAVARSVATRVFFGAGHPFAHAVLGDSQSVDALVLNDVAQAYSDLYRPEGVTVLVAGDIEQKELEAALQGRFGAWTGLIGSTPRELQVVGRPLGADRARVLLVDQPEATQTAVRFIMPAEPYSDPARLQRELLVSILGGTFTSRLNSNLRVDKGITYGARASLVMGPRSSYLVASAQVQAEHTGVAVSEFIAEFERLRSGDVSAAEATKARETHRLSIIEGLSGLSGLLETAENLAAHGLGLAELTRQISVVSGLEATALNEVARATLPVDRVTLVLVGDLGVIVPQLEGLELTAHEVLDRRGRALSPAVEEPPTDGRK